ncbi:hypothetical protein PPYR_04510, partial [Photinus pyralis]
GLLTSFVNDFSLISSSTTRFRYGRINTVLTGPLLYGTEEGADPPTARDEGIPPKTTCPDLHQLATTVVGKVSTVADVEPNPSGRPIRMPKSSLLKCP